MTAESGAAILRAVEISKTYGKGDAEVHSLRNCSIELEAGTITVIVGPSGSGKSTLLHILSGLDSPTTGEVWIEGSAMSEMTEKERAHWRARHIGFVLQRDNLIPSLTIEENVAAPLILGGMRRDDALAKARETLDLVGLSHRSQAWPATVSGGEAQRAAVARACAGSPRLIFSDEPTGALDSTASETVLELFVSLAKRTNAAMMMVTHDPDAARAADRLIRIEDGKLEHVV